MYIAPESNELHRKSKIFQDDIVVVRTGLAGTAAIVPPELDGTNYIDLLIMRRSQRITSRFLWFVMNSPLAAGQVEANAVGAIQSHYNTSTLADLLLPAPPPTEQEAITAFLDHETTKIEAFIAKVREAIGRLKEYRTAFVSAAVTGKIDVRQSVEIDPENRTPDVPFRALEQKV